MDLITKARNELNKSYDALFGEDLRLVQSSYPDENWNVWTWSDRLLKDFEALKTGSESSLNLSLGLFFNKNTLDKNSVHFDFSRKLYLYKKLRDLENKDGILIPECGPCGFELLVAIAAGFSRIVTYDISPEFIECARSIYSDYDVKLEVSSSKSFNFNLYSGQLSTAILPDWGHDSIDEKLNGFIQPVAYTSSRNFLEHKMKITPWLIKDFRERVSSL